MAELTVGSGQQFTTITAAVAAAQAGDDIKVQAGTYTNDFPSYIDGLTIEGVGGQVNLVAAAQPPNGKAIVDEGGNTTLKNLSFSGVTVNDANGAGVRYEGGNLTVENSIFSGNQDGLLGAAGPNGTITIDHSEFHDNGNGAGNTHNIYIGDIKQFTLTNSYVHDANVGHEVKSRAESNTITGTRIFDNNSTSSYSIDLPNGGNAAISNSTIEQGPNGQNPIIIAYGEEGAIHAGTSVSFTGNTVVNDLTDHYPNLFWDASGAQINASGNTVYGIPAGQLGVGNGLPSSSGFTYTSNRPALDTSSPVSTGAASPTPAPVQAPAPAPTPAPSPAPAPTSPPVVTQGGTFGFGGDTLTVTLAEGAYQGDAQASISLDGTSLTAQPVTVTASQNTGAQEAFTFKGDFGAGSHQVGVSFLNDAYGGSPSLDRNLYLDGVVLNGSSGTLPVASPVGLYSTGDSASVSVSGGTNPPAPVPTPTLPAPTSPPAPAITQGGTFGTGDDTLRVTLAEDAYQGNAQANVTIDGKVLTATPLTVTSPQGQGATEVFTFKGDFGAGSHAVAVSFLNDAYGGSPVLDRNLYLDGVALNGSANSSTAAPVGLYSTGDSASFSVSGGTSPPTATPIPAPTPLDTLTLHLSEDAWNGGAQFVASLDGHQLGAVQAVSALHAAGGVQDFTYTGAFGIGPHDLAVTFLNDAYGGSPSTDRNLYVSGADYDGQHVADTATLYSNGTAHFQIPALTGS